MTFTLRQISEITGIPVLRIRYVLDHDLIAHKRWYSDEEGWSSRRLSLDGAVLAAVIAQLVEAGISRGRVRELIDAAESLKIARKRNSLNLGWLDEALMDSRQQTTLEIGDDTHIQITIGARSSGWQLVEQPAPTLIKNFEPFVVVCANISRIRSLFAEVS